jgi:nucleoside-diphosphate-sugar epimerase
VSSVYPVRLAPLRERIELHEGSVSDHGAMQALTSAARPDVVFHLAAYTHVGKSWARVEECVSTNVSGTISLLRALEGVGYRRFVYTGTSEIYGPIEVPFREDALVQPASPYAVSKYAGERFARMYQRAHGAPIVCLRPFNAYGPAQSPDRIVPEVIVRALRRQRLPMTTGTQTREFNYVEDLVDGFVRAATAPGIDGEVVNLGCGEEVTVAAMAATVLGLMGDPISPELGALPDRPNEIMRMRSDSTLARERLGWTPAVTLEEGLRRTIAWYTDALADPASPFAV